MKQNIYKLFSSAKQASYALALSLGAVTMSAQSTYTFVYTGNTQSLSLSAGTFSIEAWGGDGYTQTSGFNGRGGYASGILTLTSPQTVYIYVGGVGGYPSGGVNANTWTFNGGGIGYPASNSAYGNGGGASDVRTVGGAWDNTTSLASRAIVAGGGGAGRNSSYIGGNGGGLTGGTGTYFSPDQTGGPTGGTQTGGGSNTGYTSGLTPATLGKAMTWDGNTLTASFLAGGGGGYYGGASGRVAGGGGSSYLGGVSSGTTIMFGQAGYVPNPDLTGNGRVIIRELCSISIFSSGNSTLTPAICSGQSLTLTTNAVSNFSWSTGQTTSSIVVAPNTNTVYSLVATSSLNCSTSASRSVNVSSGVPVMSISNPSNNICLGQTATLTASGALSYTWANPGVVNGQTFAPTSTAAYTVTGSNGCGTSSAVTTITVAPLAVFATSSSSIICEGYTATLTAVSAVNGYTWQPTGQNAATAIVSPTAATVYTVTASDGICAGTQTVLVNTKTTPVIAITPTLVSLCLGETTTLTASGAGTGGSYSWTPGNGNTAAVAVAPTSSTLYVVSGTNSLNCTATAQVPVVVVQPLPLNVTSTSTLVCSGASVNLTANGSTTYSWTNGPATAGYVVNPTGAVSVYTVTGFNTTNTCTATRTIAIAAITPSVNVTTPVSMCAGGSATVTASGATTYTWNGVPMGGNNVFVTAPAQTSTYVLIANTNSITTNCISNHTVQVVVNAIPTLTVTTKRNVICKGETNTLTAVGAASVVWQGTLGVTNTVVVKPTSTTVYTLVGTSAEGCSVTAQVNAAVSSCNGIEEFSAGVRFNVYPNPNNGQFFISAESATTVYVRDAIGKVIRTVELSAENGFSAQVNDLAKGIYFISDPDYKAVTKLLVD